MVFDVEIINERADKMNIIFSPNKCGFKAGYERKDQGSEKSGLWQTSGFNYKILRRILEWNMAMAITGRGYSYSLTAMKNARKVGMIYSNDKYR